MAAVAPLPQPDRDVAAYEMPEQATLLGDAWRRIRRNRLALVGGAIIVLLFITALVSIVWTPYPVWLQAVGPTYQPPSPHHRRVLADPVDGCGAPGQRPIAGAP